MTGLHVRNQEYIKTAHAIVDKFSSEQNKEPKTVWKSNSPLSPSVDRNIYGFSHRAIKVQLKERIDDPSLIYQDDTNTCGPAAYWYSLAYYRPNLYAKTIVNLYKDGRAILGKLTLKPDTKTLGSWQQTKIRAVDWIALASLKNTTSPKFDEPSDTIAAITLPREVNKWLTSTGWTVHKLDASTSKRGLQQLKQASKEYQSNRVVHLFVKAKSLGGSKSLWWGVDHWIALASSIQVRKSVDDSWQDINSLKTDDRELGNYQIAFKIYSWGRYVDVGVNSQYTIRVKDAKDFCKYFYGYISSNVPK